MVPLFAGAILPSVGGLSEARHQRTETLIPSQRVPLQRAGHVQDSGTQQDVSLQEALGWLCVYNPAPSRFCSRSHRSVQDPLTESITSELRRKVTLNGCLMSLGLISTESSLRDLHSGTALLTSFYFLLWSQKSASFQLPSFSRPQPYSLGV